MQGIDDNLVSQFQEINEFVKQYVHPPSEQHPESKGFEEKKLARRLASLKLDNEKVAILTSYDSHSLLTKMPSTANYTNISTQPTPNLNAENSATTQAKKPPTSIDDILRMNSQGLLSKLGGIDSSLLVQADNR